MAQTVDVLRSKLVNLSCLFVEQENYGLDSSKTKEKLIQTYCNFTLLNYDCADKASIFRQYQ